MNVAENIADVKRRIAAAAERSGRDPERVRLVAVTKAVGIEAAAAALDAGVCDLGESRVQEARRKFEAIGSRARWHMIGPLQTNKVKYCPGLFSMIHSVDRLELLEEIDRRFQAAGAVAECLLQVNISGESQKSGCAPSHAADLLKSACGMKGLRVVGLMAVPRECEDPEETRPAFRALAQLRAELAGLGIENVRLDEISAGMTDDFEIAVEEGATIVRIGSALFGERIYT